MTPLPAMVSYFNKDLGVSLRVPETWDGEEISAQQFRMFAPPEPQFDNYRSTLSYQRGVPEPNASGWFETLIAQSAIEMQNNYAEFELLTEERFMLSSFAPVYTRHYEWHSPETGLHFSQLQALINLDDAWVFLINAATLKSLESQYTPIFDAILKSTRLLRLPVG